MVVMTRSMLKRFFGPPLKFEPCLTELQTGRSFAILVWIMAASVFVLKVTTASILLHGSLKFVSRVLFHLMTSSTGSG